MACVPRKVPQRVVMSGQRWFQSAGGVYHVGSLKQAVVVVRFSGAEVVHATNLQRTVGV